MGWAGTKNADDGADKGRVTALDGLRGLLAVLVLAWHVVFYFGVDWLRIPATLAVFCFFFLSGYVLTRSWSGDYIPFLVRRFIRLWPTYALCLAVGYLIAARPPVLTEFFWYPYLGPNDIRHVDPPMWSLILEAWVMPCMPFVVWAGRGTVIRAALSLIAVIAASHLIAIEAFVLVPFIAGAFFSRSDVRNRWLESAVPQWLGKVSYSLYLSHYLVLLLFVKYMGPWGSVIALPFVAVTAWALWYAVETPSILLSRRAGKLARQYAVI
jgi:peptidoglycan/LPS O-acetylase OafA/YrhL